VILLPQYLEAAILMQILSLMLIFSPIFAVSQTMLIGLGKPSLVLRASALAMVSVVGVGALLVLQMGTSGIAYSYLLAVMLATIFSLLMLSRSVGLKMEAVFLLKVGTSTVAMALVTFFLMQQMSTTMNQVIVGVPAGAGIYLTLTLVLRTMSTEDYQVIRRTLGIARSKAPSRRQ
jgi:O-antigen/teichoic acid export membrane protein